MPMHNQRTHLVTALVPGLELQSAADQARAGERLASSTLKLWFPIRLGGVAVRRNNEVGKKSGPGCRANTRPKMAAFLESQRALLGQGD
jgi:hypothetical protein